MEQMRTLFTLLCFLLSTATFSQGIESGQVVYIEKQNIDRGDYEDFDLKKEIPDFHCEEMTLLFHQNQSCYQDLSGLPSTERTSMDSKKGDGKISAYIVRPKNIVYRNWETDIVLEKRLFLGKTFLVSGDIESVQWKITGDSKIVADQLCLGAETNIDSQSVKAWFAPSIPVPTGPALFSGLPGLILEVQIDDHEKIISAVRITSDNLDLEKMTIPGKGKKVSRNEFVKILEKKKSTQPTMYSNSKIRFYAPRY